MLHQSNFINLNECLHSVNSINDCSKDWLDWNAANSEINFDSGNEN